MQLLRLTQPDDRILIIALETTRKGLRAAPASCLRLIYAETLGANRVVGIPTPDNFFLKPTTSESLGIQIVRYFAIVSTNRTHPLHHCLRLSSTRSRR